MLNAWSKKRLYNSMCVQCSTQHATSQITNRAGTSRGTSQSINAMMLRDSPSAPSNSTLGCFNDVLELKQGIVGRLGILGVHGGVQVVRHGGVADYLGHGVVG